MGERIAACVAVDKTELQQPPSFNLSEARAILKSSVTNKTISKRAEAALSLLETDTKGNLDNINFMNAQLVFARVWRFVRLYDQGAQCIFFEQVADIMGGRCAQGRCTRLLQFYFTHIETRDAIFQQCRSINSSKASTAKLVAQII